MKLAVAMLVLVSSFAFAGKADREYMKNELTPAISTSTASIKKACGCALKISTTATVANEADMRQVKYIVEEVAAGATKYCTDADSKKAVCKMHELKLAKGTESGFKLSGAVGTATTDGQMNPSFDMMTAELDK